jgi:hypothetical protein
MAIINTEIMIQLGLTVPDEKVIHFLDRHLGRVISNGLEFVPENSNGECDFKYLSSGLMDINVETICKDDGKSYNWNNRELIESLDICHGN